MTPSSAVAATTAARTLAAQLGRCAGGEVAIPAAQAAVRRAWACPSCCARGYTTAAARATAPTLPSPLTPAPRSSQLLTTAATPPQHQHARHSSHSSHSPHSPHSPLGSTPLSARPKVTLRTLQAMHARGEPIVALTAHDFPSGSVAEAAGVDLTLVGDSLAMVALGHEDTSQVTLEEMLVCARAVSRAAGARSFLVADLPMGSYEVSAAQACASAVRMVKEGGRVQAVKIEGGEEVAPAIRRVVRAGIPVVAHVGLTPQRQSALGGFRVQGKTARGALKLLRDARAVEAAGAALVVLEAVPAEVARMVTARLSVPTIGIGAGAGCSGQVLVHVDMAGYFPPGRFQPKFVKQYADLWRADYDAVRRYREEVKGGVFPAPEHTYPVAEEELAEIKKA
ncbi:hypothetical protein KEM52_002786, partial [Ascosphaera acerosa]